MGSYFSRSSSTNELYTSLLGMSVSSRKPILERCTDEQLSELAVLSINNDLLFNNIICLGRVLPSEYNIFSQLCLQDNTYRVRKWVHKVFSCDINDILLTYTNKLSDLIIDILLPYSTLGQEILANELVLHDRLAVNAFPTFTLYDYTLYNLLADDDTSRFDTVMHKITNIKRCLELSINCHAIKCAKMIIDNGRISNNSLYKIVINSKNNEVFDYLISCAPPAFSTNAFALAVKMSNTYMATALAKYL